MADQSPITPPSTQTADGKAVAAAGPINRADVTTPPPELSRISPSRAAGSTALLTPIMYTAECFKLWAVNQPIDHFDLFTQSAIGTASFVGNMEMGSFMGLKHPGNPVFLWNTFINITPETAAVDGIGIGAFLGTTGAIEKFGETSIKAFALRNPKFGPPIISAAILASGILADSLAKAGFCVIDDKVGRTLSDTSLSRGFYDLSEMNRLYNPVDAFLSPMITDRYGARGFVSYGGNLLQYKLLENIVVRAGVGNQATASLAEINAAKTLFGHAAMRAGTLALAGFTAYEIGKKPGDTPLEMTSSVAKVFTVGLLADAATAAWMSSAVAGGAALTLPWGMIIAGIGFTYGVASAVGDTQMAIHGLVENENQEEDLKNRVRGFELAQEGWIAGHFGRGLSDTEFGTLYKISDDAGQTEMQKTITKLGFSNPMGRSVWEYEDNSFLLMDGYGDYTSVKSLGDDDFSLLDQKFASGNLTLFRNKTEVKCSSEEEFLDIQLPNWRYLLYDPKQSKRFASFLPEIFKSKTVQDYLARLKADINITPRNIVQEYAAKPDLRKTDPGDFWKMSSLSKELSVNERLALTNSGYEATDNTIQYAANLNYRKNEVDQLKAQLYGVVENDLLQNEQTMKENRASMIRLGLMDESGILKMHTSLGFFGRFYGKEEECFTVLKKMCDGAEAFPQDETGVFAVLKWSGLIDEKGCVTQKTKDFVALGQENAVSIIKAIKQAKANSKPNLPENISLYQELEAFYSAAKQAASRKTQSFTYIAPNIGQNSVPDAHTNGLRK